jgi:hypothetical protein
MRRRPALVLLGVVHLLYVVARAGEEGIIVLVRLLRFRPFVVVGIGRCLDEVMRYGAL